MIQFILEAIAFQLVFLAIYDFFLKQETFFQWNRFYLIGTYVLSLILPWVKLEMLSTAIPEKFSVYPEFLWNLDNSFSIQSGTAAANFLNLSPQYIVIFGGILMATVIFVYKLFKIQQLRSRGEVRYFPKFTRITIKNSELAFSYFRSIFLGDQVLKREHENIIQHELVHIGQWHTLDLLFFELMRIVGWFNPLVYVYQGRISELHEFIADAKVSKTHKSEQYQQLLSQVFQTENISFVNQFFKSSLIKRRIVMLQKSKSRKIWKLKYLFLVPVISAMLIYSSCQPENKADDLETISVGNIENLTQEEEDQVFGLLKSFSASSEDWQLYVKDRNSIMKFVGSNDGSYITGPQGEKIRAKLIIDSSPGTDLRKSDGDANTESLMEKFSVTTTAVSEAKAQWRDRLTSDILANDKLTDSEKSKLIEGISKLASDNFNVKPSENSDAMNSSKYIVQATINTIPFALIEQVPIFPGCDDVADKRICFLESMQNHIAQHLDYPLDAKKDGIEGVVNVMFTIKYDGSIGRLAFRSSNQLLEYEALRIIKKLPTMKPGKHQGKVANVPFSIPINFKL